MRWRRTSPSPPTPTLADSELPTRSLHEVTLPETNMETQKGPCKDHSPSKWVLYWFPCYFGGVNISAPVTAILDPMRSPHIKETILGGSGGLSK